MDTGRQDRLERVYAAHPLNANAVLDRVRNERGTLAGIRARDLAESRGGGATDQNHVGGAAAVRALAIAAGVQSGWAVLDIGTGLGGTPRLLAEECGCRCHGVELTASRFLDAVRLTTLVGLENLVTFSHGDFMEIDVPGGPFDLAIGQGSFLHFTDLPALLRRVAMQLRSAGRLAIEDAVVVRWPDRQEENKALDDLQLLWNIELQHRDRWPALLQDAGFRFDGTEDQSVLATHDLEELLASAAARRLSSVTSEERSGWELGLGLLRSGHIAVVRMLGTRLT